MSILKKMILVYIYYIRIIMIIPEDFPSDLELKIYSHIVYKIPNNLLNEIKNYHRKNTKEYREKLLDSDSEEFWEEYVTEEMRTNPNYWKNFIYIDEKIYNYKTKKPIKIKINTV